MNSFLSENKMMICTIVIVIIFAFLVHIVMVEDAMNKVKTLEVENEEMRSDIARLCDVATGYRDENVNLKLRPVLLEDEVLYFIKVYEITKLEPELLMHIQRKSIEYDVPLDIIFAVIEKESHFDNSVTNYNEWNDTHDRGLMQINTGYEDYYWSLTNIKEEYSSDLVVNPYYNVELGISYLRYQLDRFENYIVPALGAYNRGENGYKTFVNSNDTVMTDYAEDVLEKSIKFMKEGS